MLLFIPAPIEADRLLMAFSKALADPDALEARVVVVLNPSLLVAEVEVDFRAVMLVLLRLVMLMSPLIEAIDPLMFVFPTSPSASLGSLEARLVPLLIMMLLLANKLEPISSTVLALLLVFCPVLVRVRSA